MKLSEYTVSVLKNYSSINPSVLFKPGQVIKTVSPQKTVMASAAVEENFPIEGAVYDLPRFLGVLSLFEDPDLIFHDNLVEVREGRKAINYTFADKQMIIAPPDKDIQFPTPEVELDIPWSEFSGVMRASSVLGLPEIAVEAKDGEISLTALDSKNPTADTYGSAIGESAEEYRFVFRVENLKLMNLDYRVAISDKGIAKFNSINSNGPAMEYYIATEVNSTFIS